MNTSKGNTPTGLRTLRSLLVLGCALGSFASQAAPISGQGTWETTLKGRDASGNPVSLMSGAVVNPNVKYVYDTVLDLTWLANWNAGAGSSFDNGFSTTDGLMTWANANNWAASLGNGWALPTVLDTGPSGCDYANSGTDCGYNVYGSEVGRRDSPLAHMYYDTLGNLGYFDAGGNVQAGLGLTNTGPFSNMQSWVYWSGTAYAPSPAVFAWRFRTYDGFQDYVNQNRVYFAVAVRPGDVFAGSVPEPGGLALMGLAFGTLAVARRRRTH